MQSHYDGRMAEQGPFARYTRREFCFLTSAATLGLLNAPTSAQQLHGVYQFVVSSDRERILRAANSYLDAKPVAVTDSHSDRSPGGSHDYYSEGDYWWPDPKNPGGPYIRRDGFSNPDNFNEHRQAMIRLSLIVPALASAWLLTRQKKYADHADRHLRAWFVDPATKMTPNLEHAQAIFGVNKGRGIGVIDTLHLAEVARATSVLSNASALNSSREVMRWFAEYLEWMRNSKNGQEERDQENNHGTCWLLQAAEFARLTGDAGVMQWCRERFCSTILPKQVAPDGSLPLELARTKPYSYSLFDMDVLCGCAQSLTDRQYNLWNYVTADGRGLKKMMEFMVPFVADKSSWPYAHDVEHWDDLPVRNPALLFAGAAYDRSAYLTVWKRLNPDPNVPEVIRNFPIRQPLLWLQ
jgi:hypothetical protein